MEQAFENNQVSVMKNIYQKEKFLPWIVTFTAALFFFYEFMLGTMFNSITDNLMAEFNIGMSKYAYLTSIYYFSNVLFLFIAGMLLDRFSPRKIILSAMLLCIFSTFAMAYVHSFSLALVCRFLTGIGSAFCFLGPIRVASQWFSAKRMALVTGAVVTMGMSGGMAAQYPFTKLVLHFGWRGALIVLGFAGLGMLVLMFFCIKDKENRDNRVQPAENNPFRIFKSTYLNLQTVLAASYTSLMNSGVAVLGAMIGNMYLIERLGIDKSQASIVNSVLFFGVICGGPLIGWWSDKIGLRILPMRIGSLLSLMVIGGILYLPTSLVMMSVLFFCLGFFTSSGIIGYPLVAENNKAGMKVTAMSLVSLLTQGGYILYQNAFGFLLQYAGESHAVGEKIIYSLNDYQFALLLLPAAFILAFFALSQLKEPRELS